MLTVEFTLAGTSFVALNGGPQFAFTEALGRAQGSRVKLPTKTNVKLPASANRAR